MGMEVSFLHYALLRITNECEEHGDVFFGMPLYISDMCLENRDESKGNTMFMLWLQFIPIFGALHSQLRKGHTTKKDISMFLVQFLWCITLWQSAGVIC